MSSRLSLVLLLATAAAPASAEQVFPLAASPPGCIQILTKNFSQPFCPHAKDIPSLYPIPAVPQPNYTYTTCVDYYDQLPAHQARSAKSAADWCRGGAYFTFRSGAGNNVEVSGGGVQMWSRCDGSPDSPQVLFIHGYPSSSYDTWAGVSELLKDDFYVCHIDHQGMGFSDKPRAPYYYSIYEHAAAINHFVTNVSKLSEFHLVTHDMGDSIGFAFLEKFVNPATAIVEPAFRLTHHTITNGNVWLPLSKLEKGQLAMLDNHTGSDFVNECFSPELVTASVERLERTSIGTKVTEFASISSVFQYQDGPKVLNSIGQYLQQRACCERHWLDALNASAVPATLVWGQKDPVAPAPVGQFLWDQSLSVRTSAPARFIKSPSGGHYIPHDQPELFACLVRDPAADCTQHGAFEAGSTY